MTNPYEAAPDRPVAAPDPTQQVRSPAIALIVVAAISMATGGFSVIADIVLLTTGMVDVLEDPVGVAKETQIMIRMIWGGGLVIASSYVFYAGLQLLRLGNYDVARRGAILAMIPCVGPCCLLGIPFGWWALKTLDRPHIQTAFDS